jgi:hypothetical protein
MTRNRQALRILWLTLLLAAAFSLLMRATSWHAELAEANSQANLIRLQSFFFDPAPETVLVGSSFSGRLLPRYFDNTRLAPLANLGLDGSGPGLGLDLTLTRPPPVVVVEVNTLLRPPDANDAILISAVHSFRFRLSRYLRIFRAQSRPSSILYTWLKLRHTDAPPAAEVAPEIPGRSPASIPDPASTGLDPKLAEDRFRSQVQSLVAHGSRVIMVRLPAGRQGNSDDDPASVLGKNVAGELMVPYLDLGAECSRRGHALAYTDGYHLGAASAREVSQLLAELAAGLLVDRPGNSPASR